MKQSSRKGQKRPKSSYGKSSAKQPVLSDNSPVYRIPKVHAEKLHAYTDGGCLGNGYVDAIGAYAFLLVEDDNILHEYSRKIEDTTNNRCEMQAIMDCLRYIEEQSIQEPIRLFSDSEYCVKGLNIWSNNWVKRGFTGIKNPEMWKELYELSRRNLHVQYTWVKAHADNPYNNRCDELCTMAMNNRKTPTGEERHPSAILVIKEYKELHADSLLKEIYEHMDKHYPEQSHGLKGKIGEYLIKYNIQ